MGGHVHNDYHDRHESQGHGSRCDFLLRVSKGKIFQVCALNPSHGCCKDEDKDDEKDDDKNDDKDDAKDEGKDDGKPKDSDKSAGSATETNSALNSVGWTANR